MSKLKDKSLKLNKKIGRMLFNLACDWNEYSYGDENGKGGLMTFHTKTAEGEQWNKEHGVKTNDFYDDSELEKNKVEGVSIVK